MRPNARQDTRNAKRKRHQGSALSQANSLDHDMAIQLRSSAMNPPATSLHNHKHSKRVSCEVKDPTGFNLLEPTAKGIDFGKLVTA